MSSTNKICSSFILGAPPGELNEVVNDIKALVGDDQPDIIQKLKPAFQKYNEEQLVTVKLPGSTQPVLISQHNRLPSSTDQYFDTHSSKSFTFDHVTQTASSPQPYTSSSSDTQLITSLNTALQKHFSEHFPPTSTSAFTVCLSSQDESSIAILLSTTKSSPSNFLSAQWRSSFLYNPSSSSLSGTIHINVHYYEDGNVALSTTKNVPSTSLGSSSGDAIIKKVAAIEKQYQEEVNRAFVGMNEQGFRGLRRQLPVTRQKVEWEKVRGYNLSDNLKGARES